MKQLSLKGSSIQIKLVFPGAVQQTPIYTRSEQWKITGIRALLAFARLANRFNFRYGADFQEKHWARAGNEFMGSIHTSQQR